MKQTGNKEIKKFSNYQISNQKYQIFKIILMNNSKNMFETDSILEKSHTFSYGIFSTFLKHFFCAQF